MRRQKDTIKVVLKGIRLEMETGFFVGYCENSNESAFSILVVKFLSS